MSTPNEKLKPGDRCKIIKSSAGNEGKIVVITEWYVRGDPRWRYYVPHEYDVVILSLGAPLRDTLGGQEQQGPFFSGYLRKMPEAPEEERELVLAE